MIETLRKTLGQHADVAMVVLVVGILAVLFSPIPSGLLDFLILTNLSFGLLILLLTFYMPRPVEFSTFPSLLLIATLFRLSLNIAATRLILTDADAGRVIGAVGAYVVGGNYVIGLIVFLILVVVQYVVVTSGAQRVSEVAARFTLDSMPGQQMSIDADLNMGFIDQEEAKRRRKNLEREASFYGAMDGASKFVKGDAIAGIVILLINSIGGLIIGVMQLGMTWSQALQTYTLLTIGDGIVTQVPALIISVGTGIIVTRSGSDEQLSTAVFRQLASYPKTLFLVGIAVSILLFLPGLPALPVTVIATALLSFAALSRRLAQSPADSDASTSGHEVNIEAEDPYASLKVEPVEVGVGSHLAPLIGGTPSPVAERIAVFRKQHALDSGIVLPRIRFHDDPRLSENAYEIALFGVPVGKGEILPGRTLAIHPAGDTKSISGIETREPTYGLPALWIEEGQRDIARAARFTLVDGQTVFVTHLTESLKQHAATLLTRAETDRLLQRVREQQPGLVEELVPTVLSLVDIQRILQNLLREKVSIRHIEAILEALADAARNVKDLGQLTEYVRARLGASICQSLLGEANALHVLTLDPTVERSLGESIRNADVSRPLVVEPSYAEQLLGKLAAQAERMMKNNLLPVLLCSPELRRHIRSLSERVIPHMRIISLTEVPNTVNLKSFGVVSV